MASYQLPQECYAVMIVVGHGKDNTVPDTFEKDVQYPTNNAECIAKYSEILLNPIVELPNIYVSNIAPLGRPNFSNRDPTQITSRFMKSNILYDLYQTYYDNISSRITGRPHDPTVMTFNVFILELLFSGGRANTFLALFDNGSLFRIIIVTFDKLKI